MHHREHTRSPHQRRYTPAELRQAPPAEPQSIDIAASMSALFISRHRDGCDTTHIDLRRAGFSERDIIKHYDAANELAGEQIRDLDINEPRTRYDREARVMLGANAVAGLLLNDASGVYSACRLAGMPSREIGNLFDDIIGEAMRMVRVTRIAEVN